LVEAIRFEPSTFCAQGQLLLPEIERQRELGETDAAILLLPAS
jgi:hypothetical protein